MVKDSKWQVLEVHGPWNLEVGLGSWNLEVHLDDLVHPVQEVLKLQSALAALALAKFRSWALVGSVGFEFSEV